jgi:PAS domain-containing protein
MFLPEKRSLLTIHLPFPLHFVLLGYAGHSLKQDKQTDHPTPINAPKMNIPMERPTDGLFIHDSNGDFVEINPQGCKMRGHSFSV